MLAVVIAGAFGFREWSLGRSLATPEAGGAVTETLAADQPLV